MPRRHLALRNLMCATLLLLAGCTAPARPSMHPAGDGSTSPDPGSAEALSWAPVRAAAKAQLAQAHDLAETTQAATMRYIGWEGAARQALQRAQALQAEGNAEATFQDTAEALYYLSVVEVLDGKNASRSASQALQGTPSRHALQASLEANATRIDRVREQGTDPDGQLLLLIGQGFHARAQRDLSVLAQREQALEDVRTTGSEREIEEAARRVVLQRVQVSTSLQVVERTAHAASRRTGPPAPWVNAAAPLAEARARLDAVPSNTTLEERPLSAYHRAKVELPARMALLEERGWPEGALAVGLDALRYATFHRRAQQGQEATQEVANGSLAALEEVNQHPLGAVMWMETVRSQVAQRAQARELAASAAAHLDLVQDAIVGSG